MTNETKNELKRYGSITEVAAILDVHYHTVMRMLRRGDLEYIKIGKTYRILLSQLEVKGA